MSIDKRPAFAVLAIIVVVVLLREYSLVSAVTRPAKIKRWSGSSADEACEEGNFTRPSAPLINAKNKKVLVTGAAGFIASHVAQACKDLGMEVVGIDDMSGGFIENVPKGVTFIIGDIKDAHFMEKVFKEHGPFNYVYHLAAYAAEGMSHFIRSYNYRNNLVGSIEVLNQAIRSGKCECFVFTSSIAAYGAAKPPIREGDPMHPEDPYGIAKHAVELDLLAAKELFDMDFMIFRPHNVYGPHQNIADRYRNVIGIFMNQILNKQDMTLFGDGEQTRAFSYIDDVAPIIARGPLIPEAHNEAFNVGAETPYSLNKLTKYVAKSMGSPEYPVKHLDKRFEVQNAESTHVKMHCYFNPPAATDLQTGLDRTADWVRARTKGFKPVEFENVEVMRNMPKSWVRKDMYEMPVLIHTAANNTNFDQSKSAVEVVAAKADDKASP